MHMSYTIAAISTGLSVSAIGILRLTGDHCASIAGSVFTLNSGIPLKDAPNRKLMLGTLHDKDGRVIDQCMAVYTRAPHTYTGEDTVEI
jgi:tRNA modification GTPase